MLQDVSLRYPAGSMGWGLRGGRGSSSWSGLDFGVAGGGMYFNYEFGGDAQGLNERFDGIEEAESTFSSGRISREVSKREMGDYEAMNMPSPEMAVNLPVVADGPMLEMDRWEDSGV